ncbi:MAG: galactosyltransferase-related protein [Bacteroidota bacterium]
MSTCIDIIYCYRNRDVQRVKNSLDSLMLQSSDSFKVIFIDYGSDDAIASEIKTLCGKYSFCTYIFIDSQGKMWNRADALNYGFYFSTSDHVFTSDVDMLFDKDFVKTISSSAEANTAKFYAVGYLSEANTKSCNVNDLSKLKYTKSEDFALGMVLLPKSIVVKINGYNSFYAIWGQEDNDMKYRIESAGFSTKFVDDNVYMFHQYHPISNADESSIPVGWLQFIKDYFDNYKIDKPEFGGLNSVRFPLERPAKHAFFNEVTFTKLDYRKLFIRHHLINSVFNISSGDHVAYIFDVDKNTMKSSLVYNLGHMLNKFFRLINIPLEVKSKYKEQYIDGTEIKNEIYFILKSLELYIVDYYIKISDSNIKLVIVKK